MKKILCILPMLVLVAYGGTGVGGLTSNPPAPLPIFIPQAGAPVGSGNGTTLGTVHVSPNAQEVAMLQLVNEVRTRGTINGEDAIKGSCVDGAFTPGVLKELTYNGVLAYAARKHALYLGTYGQTAHFEPERNHPSFYGSSVQDRVDRAFAELAPAAKNGNGWRNENAGYGSPWPPTSPTPGWTALATAAAS